MPAELTASTGRLPSCWPWSISPGSIPVKRRPARSTVTPASRSTRRSARSISLGPSTAVERLRLAALSICSRASGAGSQSSCSSQIHSTAGSGARAGSRHRPARRGMLQRASDGGAVPGVGVHAEGRVRTEELGQRGSAPVLAAGVDADRAVHGMRLLPYRVDEPREQSRTVVHNDHEGHRVAQRQGVL